jgi:hypothetical protein
MLGVWPAAAIQYNVSDSTGTLSIEGFIETNGTTGQLSDSDIVDWSLTVKGFGAPLTLDKKISDLSIHGTSLSATTKSLVFDYGSGDGSAPGWLVVWIDPATRASRQADIGWKQANPSLPGAVGTPGFSIGFRNADFYYDIHQVVRRRGTEIIGVAP